MTVRPNVSATLRCPIFTAVQPGPVRTPCSGRSSTYGSLCRDLDVTQARFGRSHRSRERSPVCRHDEPPAQPSGDAPARSNLAGDGLSRTQGVRSEATHSRPFFLAARAIGPLLDRTSPPIALPSGCPSICPPASPTVNPCSTPEDPANPLLHEPTRLRSHLSRMQRDL
jgi:hypothetical protein